MPSTASTCLEPIRARLDADRLKVIGFYDDMRVRYLDEAEYQPVRSQRAGISQCQYAARTGRSPADRRRETAQKRLSRVLYF